MQENKPNNFSDTVKMITDQYNKNELTLSFSSLNAFAKSPRHFVNYKMGKQSTDAMKFGSAMHLAILRPKEYKEKITIIPKLDKRTKEGKAKYEELTKDIENPETIITEEEAENINKIKDALYSNDASHPFMTGSGETELYVEGELFGFKFRGFIDKMMNDGCFFDLKKFVDADPVKSQRIILNNRYWMQGAIYRELTGVNDSFILGADSDANVSVFQLSDDLLDRGLREVEKYTTRLRECIEIGNLHMSYDFNCPNNSGIYYIDNPNYNI